MFKNGIHFLIKHEADGGNGGNGGVNPEGGQGGQGGTPDPSDPENPDGKPAPDKAKTFTQEELDKIISDRTTRAVTKALQERDDASNEAERMKNLTKQQRADLEKEKLQKRIDELEAKQVRTEMSGQARAKLAELDVTATDDVINLLVTDKAETTIANVQMYAKAIETAVEKRYQKDRIGGTPGSTAGSAGKEQTLGERLASQAENEQVKANDPFASLERG